MTKRYEWGHEGRYRIDRPVGKGISECFVAYDDLGHKKIVKFPNPDFMDIYKHEVDSLREIRHPAVVSVFDISATEKPFVVLDYIDGEDLDDFLNREEPLSADFARTLAGRVCEGLHAIHEKERVHCDIKPGNIRLDTNLKPIITDLGFCRIAGFAEEDVLGTPDYLSPEQCSYMRLIDHRSDIYSLGIVLYEMLTGQVPYGGTVSQVLRHHVYTPIKNPQSINPRIPNGLVEAVLRSTQKKPEDRYQSAEEFQKALTDSKQSFFFDKIADMLDGGKL